MKALTLTVLLLLLVCSSGCRWGLPEGEAPVGNLVDNPIPEKLSREQLILSLGSRIAASSMELFPGGPITIEGKETSYLTVPFSFDRTLALLDELLK